MIAMIFEFWLRDEHTEEYQRHGQRLRQLVEEIDGFVSIERYRSEADPNKILALGFFTDEAAVREWRNVPEHRHAQILGRQRFFSDYRLRMATISRDYGMEHRTPVPTDSQVIHSEIEE